MSADGDAEYAEYVARFDAAAEEILPVGGFAKFKGKLIKKLTAAEFSDKNKEYLELAGHYFQSLDRGDTINDVVVKLVRERAAELVLTSPV
jgi:hypothetical protein